MRNIVAILLALFSTTVLAQITGAGATFPAPLYAKWADAYSKETGIKINYQSIGSGGGIKQIEARTVTFGASDMPLTDDQLKAMNAMQFPTVIGGVVPVINLKDIKSGELKLTGTMIADIYLGKIIKWNDPAIVALNPKLKLPDDAIAVVRRADGSGTTFIFTNYLSKVSSEFKQKINEGTAVQWVVGLGGKGNEGVASYVTRIPNSIGYVEYAYVKQSKMISVQMQNAAGAWVSPEEDAFKAAAIGADWNKSFYQILTNQPNKAAWPISGATFIIMPLQNQKPEDAQGAIKFFTWAYKNGGKMADELDYVTMPASVVTKIQSEMAKIK
jgi:phosphate transport system substrate-binding protein